jgi:hypothetical protein
MNETANKVRGENDGKENDEKLNKWNLVIKEHGLKIHEDKVVTEDFKESKTNVNDQFSTKKMKTCNITKRQYVLPVAALNG